MQLPFGNDVLFTPRLTIESERRTNAFTVGNSFQLAHHDPASTRGAGSVPLAVTDITSNLKNGTSLIDKMARRFFIGTLNCGYSG